MFPTTLFFDWPFYVNFARTKKSEIDFDRDITSGKHNSRVEWQKSWVVGCYITSSSSFPLGPGVGVAALSQQFSHCTNVGIFCIISLANAGNEVRGRIYRLPRFWAKCLFFACGVANLTEKRRILDLGCWLLTRLEPPRDMAIRGGDSHLSVPLSISQANVRFIFFFLGKVLLLHGFRRRRKAALLEMKWKYTPA